MTTYRCDECRTFTTAPNFTDESFVDFEGEIHYRNKPICPECSAPCQRVSAMTQALIDIATPVQP